MIAFRLLALPMAAATALAATTAQATPSTQMDAGRPAIAWATCPETWVGISSDVLGDRLECGTLSAPLDHATPDGRTVDVGVIRIRAARIGEREGAIFLNTGGPGGHPGRLLRSMAEGWSRADPDDRDDGDKRRLADRFDMVAVIPRGLEGSEPLGCISGLPPRYAYMPANRGDDNWALAVQEAQAVADACTALPNARFITTEQHVHDMDAVRRALGDERLNFYGISYGGKVGAWYAAMYPDHTGRLLLDSSMAFTHDYRTALQMVLEARQAHFQRTVIAPVIATPALYGLPGDADSVALALEDFPGRAREAWAPRLTAPTHLAAALWLVDWLQASPHATLRTIRQRIRATRFSRDSALDAQIGWAANQLADIYFAPPGNDPRFTIGAEGDSVRMLMSCNDSAWLRTEAEIRESLARNSARIFQYDGEDVLEELTCTRWGGQSAREPDLTPLGRAAPFLLIQSENDMATPLRGGSFIVDRFANARMLLVRNSDLHGVFNFTATGCIERTAAHYLLTGSLPESRSRVFSCDVQAGAPIDALLGTPKPPAADPVPVEQPGAPGHDEA
jgi:pimeloyl-ACP methyl ester carboxylesterase